MRLGCPVRIMTYDAAASPGLNLRARGVHYMKPVKIFADHDPVAHGVVPESCHVSADVLAQQLHVMARETKFEGVFGLAVTRMIFIEVFFRKGLNEQHSVVASMGLMTYDAAVIPGRRLMGVSHLRYFLFNIFQFASARAFLHLDVPVMAAQADHFRTADEKGILVA